ncbi:uncharacterized protein NPIL_218201 [Nephila pilipes]|uniref:Uncharacterized protein n=1 Tax=Nephila pilipes TaxID=299642 RepID=A0A8X6P440_NEPPI|nr:uncharacterized protein NPIL_218201 [Nephila pilipes]
MGRGVDETTKQNKHKRGAEVKIPTRGCGGEEKSFEFRRGWGERQGGGVRPAGVDVPGSWNIHEQDGVACLLYTTRPYIRAYFVTDAPADSFFQAGLPHLAMDLMFGDFYCKTHLNLTFACYLFSFKYI